MTASAGVPGSFSYNPAPFLSSMPGSAGNSLGHIHSLFYSNRLLRGHHSHHDLRQQGHAQLPAQRLPLPHTGDPFPASVSITGSGNDISPALSLGGVSPTLNYYQGSGTAGASPPATPPTSTGTYTVVASFAGSSNYLAVESNPVSFTISIGAPKLGLTSTSSSALYGQPITFTATVTAGDAPTGTITFLDNGTPLGTAPLTGPGFATLTISFLAPGPHSITATYSGDSHYSSADSGPASASISQASTTISFVPTPVLRRRKLSPKT